jgi:hypothetical protein
MTDSAMGGQNSRTHEPSHREMVVQLDALERLVEKNDEAIREVMQERDRRYEDRFKAQETTVGDRFKAAETAVSAALAAQEKSTSASFTASEKAIGKAEAAQSDYNIRSNEFRGQLDDQAKTLMPRAEASVQFRSYDEKIEQLRTEIAGLRESRSEGGGRQSGQQYIVGLLIAIAGIVMGVALRFIK